METASDAEINGKIQEIIDQIRVKRESQIESASHEEINRKAQEIIDMLKVQEFMESASDDAEIKAKIQELIDKLKVIAESSPDAEINGKAQDIIDILKVQEIMESASGDAEIKEKIQEFINILKVRNIMRILQLPYDQCLQYYGVFNEHMQNPEIAARVQTEFDVKVQKLSEDIQLAREKLEKSLFFEEFMRQMQNPELVARLERVIGTDPLHSQLQLVLYGIGHLRVEQSRMQFAFAILLREKFSWVNDIEVYDPVLSPLERRLINESNCTSLRVNENARRTVDRPTLFFMPHCPVSLHENLFQANWTPDNFNKIIVLGNSLKSDDTFDWILPKIRAVRNTDHVMYEIPLPEITIKNARPAAPSNSSPEKHTVISGVVDPHRVFRSAFRFLSWHFFAWDDSLSNPSTVVD